MISDYLLKFSLNRVTFCIFEREISSRFKRYQVQIEYFGTNNETEAFLQFPICCETRRIQQILI